jgi:uncharacterized protein
MEREIWIDIINPSHPLFFRPLIKELYKTNIVTITLRDRGETIKLAEQFGLYGRIYGKDYEDPIKKIVSFANRTFAMCYSIKNFDYAISFENPMSVTISKLRGKKSILLLDNDLKYKIQNNFFQNLESKIKLQANTIIIPRACDQTFKKYNKNDKFKTYNGYKEDFYIADYQPDDNSLEKLPFDDYILIRGEALASFYVNKKQTILPQLFDLLTKENINILFLARDKSDFNYFPKKENISLLNEPINGLDLIYYSNVVLTGSGTMAREAACMGKPAVSFFPGNELLSVDIHLINEGKILHSRDPKEIVEYVLSNYKKKRTLHLERSANVKKEILKIINTCIE